jgi:hypothetical protein
MFVVDHAGDHDIADTAVQRRRLAHDVHPPHLSNVPGNLRQHLVRCHPQRIINIDDERLALLQPLNTGQAQPVVHAVQLELAQGDNLHLNVKGVLAGNANEPDIPLCLQPGCGYL